MPPADRLHQGAARVEAAAGGGVDRVRWVPGQGRHLRPRIRVHRGHRGQERRRIGMGRRGQHRVGRADLDHLAEIHHRHPVADEADHVEIVADEQVGEVELLLEVHQQVQHLGLHRFIQGRDRLIKHDEAWLEGERTSDVHALALAAGEFVRVAGGKARGLQPHPGEQAAGALDGLALRHTVHPRPEGDRALDGHARVEGGVAVLEHHLGLRPEIAQGQRPAADALSVEQQVAGIVGDQAHDEPGRGGLAAARFADDPEGLALQDLEIDAVHRPHHGLGGAEALLHREMLHEAVDGEEGLGRTASVAGDRNGAVTGGSAHAFTSMADRRPSENRLNEIETMKMARPGSAATIGFT